MNAISFKTGNDFREAALKNNRDYWAMHNCSMCGYECGFLFFQYEDAEVAFDAGCDCTRRYVKSARTWDDVAEQYNMNIKNDKIRQEYDDYWGFN